MSRSSSPLEAIHDQPREILPHFSRCPPETASGAVSSKLVLARNRALLDVRDNGFS